MVTPIPVRLALTGACVIPIYVGAVVLFPIHVVGAIFVAVPLMVVFVT